MFAKPRLQFRLGVVLCIMISMVVFMQPQFIVPAYAADTVTINLASQLGAPTYRASGFLYGISRDGTQPPANLQSDIKTRFMRAGGSQINCPNGGAVNGDYAPRWNSTLAYFRRAQAIGARLIILPSDIWGADAVCTVPRWPGDNGNWTEYTNFLNQLISDVRANGMTGSNVEWDIWNEPDLSIFWGRSQSQYLETWRRAYQQIRAAIPNAVITGPNTAAHPSPGNTWWTTYLDFVRANNVIPNYLGWHDENGGDDPQATAATLSSMISSRGISVTGFQVNEYGAQSEQDPGRSAWFLARYERAGVDALRGNWSNFGGLYAGMGALVTASGQTMGVWWTYRRYADITGQRVSVTAGANVDGVAGTDSAARKAVIVLGARATPGATTVQINGFGSAGYLLNNGQVNVLVERMPSGTGVVNAPVVVSNGGRTVTNNALTVSINWTSRLDSFAITLTPSSGGGGPTPTPTGNGVQIVNRNSGKCLDVEMASTTDGANVLQWTCNGQSNQRWRVEDVGGGNSRLVAVHSNKCLDVEMASTADGANILQWTCNSQSNQTWRVESLGNGFSRLVAQHSGKVADVANCGTGDGVDVRQLTWLNNNCQQWQLVP
jgi:hypothetical protein